MECPYQRSSPAEPELTGANRRPPQMVYSIFHARRNRSAAGGVSPPSRPHQVKFPVFRQMFLLECSRLDPAQDTFAGIMARTEENNPAPPPKLSQRERASLPAVYLRELSDVLRRDSVVGAGLRAPFRSCRS